MPPQEPAVEASTLSRSNDTANYVIYPRDVKNQDQTKAIQILLESFNPKTLYVSSTDYNTVIWFSAITLTSGDAEKVKADPNVRICNHFRSKGSSTDKSRSLQWLKNANHTTIRQICDPPGSQSKHLDDGAEYEERSSVVKRDGQTVNALV